MDSGVKTPLPFVETGQNALQFENQEVAQLLSSLGTMATLLL